MPRPTVILLSSTTNLQRVLKTFKLKDDAVIIIALDETARKSAQELKLAFHSVADYLQLSESELREKADEFSRQWYHVNGQDYSAFDGFSLGELMYVEIGYRLFFELERWVVFIKELMTALKPQSWILATNQNHTLTYIIRSVSDDYSIGIHQVTQTIWHKMIERLDPSKIKFWLWKNGLDRFLRDQVFKLKLSNRKIAPISSTPSKVLFVVDIPTSSVMETLIPVIKKVSKQQRLVVVTDPRCQLQVLQNGINGIPFNEKSFRIHPITIPETTKNEIKERWNKINKAMSSSTSPMVFRGVNLWPICQNDIQTLFLRRIPTALQHVHLATEVIRQNDVAVVVTAADTHYSGQLFVRTAERLGVKSLTIQHGMVNHPQGYLPIRSSQLAVMGEAIREWCIQNGASPEQIVVTGQPRFDSLIAPPTISRHELLRSLDLEPEKPTWLITPERHLGLWMRDVILDALESLSEVQAIIRVHHTDSPENYKLGLKFRGALKQRVRISRQYDSPSALNACDVIVLGRSTMGLEALMVKKPLIAIHPSEEKGWIVPPYLKDYLSEAPFLRAQNQQELLDAWQYLSATNNQHHLERVRKRIVSRYAGEIDGESASRVIEAIQKLGWRTSI